MIHDQPILLLSIGGSILALVSAACLLLCGGTDEQEVARRIGKLREGATVVGPQSSRFVFALISSMRRLGNAMRDKLMSARDAEALAKTLAASGFEPSKAMPVFISAKVVCLFVVPAIVYLGTVFLGYSTGKQVLYTTLSLGVAMALPNWVMRQIRRSYQQALRCGIPDALDLMVVCAEAGLGLESAVERVAQEMKQSNRPVGIEFSLLTYEMRIYPDRRIALTNLAERTGQSALKRLAGTIAQTLKYGTPLSQGLRTLAAEMRNERLIQFEERAGRLPALLVLPMVLFILPCLFIVLMGQPVTELLGALGNLSH
jgi:tight adherence protein C